MSWVSSWWHKNTGPTFECHGASFYDMGQKFWMSWLCPTVMRFVQSIDSMYISYINCTCATIPDYILYVGMYMCYMHSYFRVRVCIHLTHFCYAFLVYTVNILDNGQFVLSKAIWFHASEENFKIFREVFISRTMVSYRKFITDSAPTRTLNVLGFDKADNSSRP